MNIFRFILGLIGIVGTVIFIAPMIMYGIVNIGNSTGVAMFGLLLAYACFMNKVNSLIVLLWSNIVARIAMCTVGIAVIVIAMFVIAESICMVYAANKQPGEDVTLIVLGCKVDGERATLMLTERLEAAYEFLLDNDGAVCVLSGGKGNGENITEAECMYRYLLDKGIDASRLYKEEESTSTRENIAFSKRIIDEYGLPENIAIATSEFHVYRAGVIAEGLGYEYTSVPAKTAWWLFPTYYFRELYGIMYQWFL